MKMLISYIKNSVISYINNRVIPHLRAFWTPWLVFLLMFAAAFLPLPWRLYLLLLLMLVFIIVLLCKPMNMIYGLIGTRGDIKLFFRMFIYINIFFSGFYYFGFFEHAGITYDINQPHVEFNLFESCSEDGIPVLCDGDKETLPIESSDSIHFYYRTTYPWVLKNTILTSLMQEPTDFFSVTSTFTGSYLKKQDSSDLITETFHWFLIFHILVSWILLGVFISLLYSKFRNES